MTSQHQAEQLFHGVLADEYHFLERVCPAAADISRRVGEFVATWNGTPAAGALSALELGCGTGITTACLLGGRRDLRLLSVDNAPAMLRQARAAHATALAEGRLVLREADALSALGDLPDDSVDLVASAYTVHNFLCGYRHRVLTEVLRVLKPGGVFVNGDRYALDDPAAHLAATQDEVRGYFRVFLGEMNRPDLLEQWVVHLFSDESEEHIMRLTPALAEMAGLGYAEITRHFRDGVNALVSGIKPWR